LFLSGALFSFQGVSGGRGKEHEGLITNVDEDASASAENEDAPPDDGIPSFLNESPSSKNLRQAPPVRLTTFGIEDFLFRGDLLGPEGNKLDEASLAKLSDDETVALFESFQTTFPTAAAELRDLDLSGATDELKNVASVGRDYIATEVTKVVEDTIKFLKSLFDHEQEPKAAVMLLGNNNDEEDHNIML
jgi:hypothetical protein